MKLNDIVVQEITFMGIDRHAADALGSASNIFFFITCRLLLLVVFSNCLFFKSFSVVFSKNTKKGTRKQTKTKQKQNKKD